MNNRADVLVIGGGMAGVGAAARLAGEAEVILLEAEDAIGRHSTGRSAAIFLRNYGNATLRALNASSESVFREPEGISDSSLLSRRGEMLVASEEELPDLEAYMRGAEGMERLTPEEALELVPILRPEAIAAAAIERDASDIDVDRMLQGFARLLRREGGRIVTEAGARGITRQNGLWRVETLAGIFEAPLLVNAAGAWADEVAALAGLTRLGLQPLRRSAAILPLPEEIDISAWPLFASAAERWYAKPEAGKLMVSPADEDPVEPHDAWADDMVIAEGLARYQEFARVDVTRVETTWAGLRSFAPDRALVIGPDAADPTFLWCAGQGGYGFQTAPAAARLLAALATGTLPDLDAALVAALLPARFAR
jgi:D-arginine dehydrogenase